MTQAYPNAKNADKLFDNWQDKDNNYFSYNSSALAIIYNTKLVKTPPKDWSDLTSPQYNKLIYQIHLYPAPVLTLSVDILI